MTNPLLSASPLENELPDFAKLRDEHYLPAFEHAVSEHLREIDQILYQEEVSFENTVVAMERSGQLLSTMLMVFYNKSSSDTNEELQKLEAEIGPRLAAHMDSIRLNPRLFARLTKLEPEAENLAAVESRLLEKYLEDFKFAGAALDEAARGRVAEINETLSGLEAEFDKRLLADSNDLAVQLSDDSRLQGLSTEEIQSLAEAAKERGLEGYVIPLLNYSGHPLLASLQDRELRQEILERTLSRGSRGNSNDTSDLVIQMLTLRNEKAALFGYDNYAQYTLSQQTAKNPGRVHEVLRKIAPVAKSNAQQEAKDLSELRKAETGESDIAAWDWDRYTEQLRTQRFDIDTTVLKPYFELWRVLENGVFFAANKLYGLSFTHRPDLIAYHPDARVYQVDFEDQSRCGLYIFDPYARPSKRGGAWMNNLVDQSQLLNKLPIVVNNMNIPKPAAGNDALMTLDEVNTLFHEFGHTLHGLLSSVKYPRFSGTNVERDFVEFPSQVNEMWMLWPEVLQNYAVHHKTGEKLALEWIEKLQAAGSFNQGFETTHYLQAAILDLALHETNQIPQDLAQFEREAIADYGLEFAPVPTRYRTNYFAHIFAGGYAAGYYGYIWSEILDAESVNWFKENGGLSRQNGKRFAEALLTRGGETDSMELVEQLLGRKPEITPLLVRRGLN
ncbi:M3 family metallopeptidase [Aquiluna borgnonia]|uniref:M3 family metallopeptidase n=1 Tax=Aquiluna borgnonia TaxID=2499157 RepID=A0A7D4QBA4_9MICO|nr:M3 family metallopeptidase [Aquiluna borgnonia]QKJ25150.1 M3 family metallopeptidase [Aquiluna borgnonia]